MKITGSPPIDSMMLPVSLCPDPCLSRQESSSGDDESGADSSDSDTTVEEEEEKKEVAIPSLLKDEETEFDAFLLDAVQWL